MTKDRLFQWLKVQREAAKDWFPDSDDQRAGYLEALDDLEEWLKEPTVELKESYRDG